MIKDLIYNYFGDYCISVRDDEFDGWGLLLDVPIDDIVRSLLRFYGQSDIVLYSISRDRHYVLTRQVLCYLLVKHKFLNPMDIMRLGYVIKRSIVYNSVRQVCNLLQTDKVFRDDFRAIEELIMISYGNNR
jgi:chromosomal replication initiation ATPase DnaA